ncbi:hypothetical protein [Methylobacterium sp. Leaf112]|uniref:hypothetical protein n=1 Tax=Methylobacterium sp. Leaf112 TaxID=1736258 RepID=UPI0006F3E3C8|nr:hypothetical protein [Methylobacterium sp. Leaf112]KQP62158.1 hypothetical protein ASF52_05730 [Methylobacterium sp. Leaf112]
MFSVSSFAEDVLYGSDKPGIVLRKRAVATHCADSYLSDKGILLDMCRARICRLGMRSRDIHQSIPGWRAGEHWRLLDGEYDVDISLKRAYQIAEAIGLRKVAFGFEDPDLVQSAAASKGTPPAVTARAA